MNQYAEFTDQIPNEILKNTEKYLCNNIALFKPDVFLSDITFTVEDYHIVIPSEIPPKIYVNRRPVQMSGSGIFLINPGDIVACTENSAAKRYYSLLVKPRFLRQVAGEMGYAGEVRFGKTLNPLPVELLQAIRALDMETRRADSIPLILTSLEVQIAAIVLRDFKTDWVNKAGSLSQIDSYISRAEDYMQSYYSSNITIEDICGEIHVSPFHFIRMFKRKTGITPHQFLLRVRIEKARGLLASGRYSISEAASACGFVSVSHFCEKFKEITGHSPGGNE